MNEDELRRHSNVVMDTLAWLFPFAWMGVAMTFGWAEAIMFGPIALIVIVLFGGAVRYLNGPDDFIEIDRKYQRMRDDRAKTQAAINAANAKVEALRAADAPEKPNDDDVQPETSYREPAVQHVCRCGKLSHHA